MKTINLFFDFEFTSLSPDAQPISLGIISQELKPVDFPELYDSDKLYSPNEYKGNKSFYAEFSDFDINRCDDWVKENVVKKLKFQEHDEFLPTYGENSMEGKGSIKKVKIWLEKFLKQFSDYQIQFVGDCTTFDWYWMLQLLGEWDRKKEFCFSSLDIYTRGIEGARRLESDLFNKAKGREIIQEDIFGDSTRMGEQHISIITKTGLPKLPENISPVPFDLNDLIAIKKGITPKEAFDLDREILANDFTPNSKRTTLFALDIVESSKNKHNSLFDAKVIKEIYNKLNA